MTISYSILLFHYICYIETDERAVEIKQDIHVDRTFYYFGENLQDCDYYAPTTT